MLFQFQLTRLHFDIICACDILRSCFDIIWLLSVLAKYYFSIQHNHSLLIPVSALREVVLPHHYFQDNMLWSYLYSIYQLWYHQSYCNGHHFLCILMLPPAFLLLGWGQIRRIMNLLLTPAKSYVDHNSTRAATNFYRYLLITHLAVSSCHTLYCPLVCVHVLDSLIIIATEWVEKTPSTTM